MNKVWIINGATGDVEPGNYRCRVIRNGPWLPVRVREIEGGYEFIVNGRLIENYMDEFPTGLFGIYEEDFIERTRLDDAKAFDKKLRDQVNEKGAPVNRLTAPLPF